MLTEITPIHNVFPVSKEVVQAISHLPAEEINRNMDGTFDLFQNSPDYQAMRKFLEERAILLFGCQRLRGPFDREAYYRGVLGSMFHLMCEAANRGGSLAEITPETIEKYRVKIYGSPRHKETATIYLQEAVGALSLNFWGSSLEGKNHIASQIIRKVGATPLINSMRSMITTGDRLVKQLRRDEPHFAPRFLDTMEQIALSPAEANSAPQGLVDGYYLYRTQWEQKTF